MRPRFEAGRNIAMKVPEHEYDATVAFYRDVLALPVLGGPATGSTASTRFDFGDKVLWVDRMAGFSQAEIWLEIVTDDVAAAAAHLARHGCVRRDGIEPLPEGFTGFWVSAPPNIIHLVTTVGDA